MLVSLSPYLVTYFLSTVFFLISDKTSKILKLITTCIGIAIPCILAACRDLTVGTDVTVYLVQHTRGALSNDLINYLHIFSDQPIGYLVLIYVSANFFEDIHGCMAVIELVIMICVYKTVSYYSKNKTAVPMLIFYLSLYCYTLNIMKQMIAVSVVFLASTYLHKKDIGKYILVTVIACLIHQTAIVGFTLYPIFKIIENRKNITIKKITLYLGCIFGIFVVYLLQTEILQILTLIRPSYAYISEHTEEAKFDRFSFIFLLLIIISYLFRNMKYHSENNMDENLFDFITFLSFFGYILREFTLIGLGMERIAYYFQIYSIIYFNNLNEKSKINLFEYIYILILFVSFCSTTINGLNEVYPYSSQILNLGSLA